MSADIVSPVVRSRMMSGIRGKDTRPELAVRSALHRAGFRFRLHRKDLPGRPDLVFPRYRAVLLIHGCFWHGHDCHLFKWPSTRQDFWRSKIEANIARDGRQRSALLNAGWRVGIIWECAIKGRARLPIQKVVEACAQWLISDQITLEVEGDEARTTG